MIKVRIDWRVLLLSGVLGLGGASTLYVFVIRQNALISGRKDLALGGLTLVVLVPVIYAVLKGVVERELRVMGNVGVGLMVVYSMLLAVIAAWMLPVGSTFHMLLLPERVVAVVPVGERDERSTGHTLGILWMETQYGRVMAGSFTAGEGWEEGEGGALLLEDAREGGEASWSGQVGRSASLVLRVSPDGGRGRVEVDGQHVAEVEGYSAEAGEIEVEIPYRASVVERLATIVPLLTSLAFVMGAIILGWMRLSRSGSITCQRWLFAVAWATPVVVIFGVALLLFLEKPVVLLGLPLQTGLRIFDLEDHAMLIFPFGIWMTAIMVETWWVKRMQVEPSDGGGERKNEIVSGWVVLIVAIALGSFSAGQYFIARGADYLGTYQLSRHLNMIQGSALNPWQYRVLTPHLVQMVIDLLKTFGITDPSIMVFRAFRLVLDPLILVVAYQYFRRLGISSKHALLAMCLLAWAIGFSHYDSDLSFNTFFDLLFYLLAAVAVLTSRLAWVPLIVLLAALNRETSGLIPLLTLFLGWAVVSPQSRKQLVIVSLVSIAIYLVVFILLRQIYGARPFYLPYGHHPGLEILVYNFGRPVTGKVMALTFGIIPILALFAWKLWSRPMRMVFWSVFPVWFLVHSLAAVLVETRLMLVPYALVFIPGALVLAQWLGRCFVHQWQDFPIQKQ